MPEIERASIIERRRMIRRYSDQAVDPHLIEALLSAATRAPSPHNRQPWRFAVLTGEARVCLAQAMGEQLRLDLTHDGLDVQIIEQDAQRSYQRITSAPASILACLSMRDMDHYPDARRNEAEHWMAGQAVAAAIENILLKATELGLGACWMCAPLFCQPVVTRTLGLPTDWEPQALVTLGYAADAGKDRPRLSPAEISVQRSNCETSAVSR
jgi:F420 biosynthesis protein FbiB-like protein